MDRPATRFAWNGDMAIAFQTIGEGAPDLLYLQGYISNVELNWEQPVVFRFLQRLGQGRRVIVMDARGMGCSDRGTPRDVPPLETMMDDVVTVLDATGADRAVIVATQEMGFVGCMFAATYPERALGLVLFEASANYTWSEETPWEWTDERWDEQRTWFHDRWGTHDGALDEVREAFPSLAGDDGFVDWWHRYRLLSQAPGSAVANSERYRYTDIRAILATIHVPAVVMFRKQSNEVSSISGGRFLAERLPGARLVELPGAEGSLWAGEQGPVHAAIDSFVDEIDTERSELERVLATVLFTDIVGSTERAAELGDRAWKALLERHHAHVRALLDRYRGIEIDTAGDGFFATFDGPARAIRCARAIIDSVRQLGIEVRAGLHTGECETIDGKVGGIAVNIGARVGAAAGASEVLVSQTVKDLVVGSGAVFEERGERELKGIPGTWRLYAVTG
ncbi:MAG TPA: adenylate/guanylate cyclase domain-containing protein [Actinomycetota bacterium]|nr:adenylate/guanylate cyclase domain-containing protein [Actinomycetota bacterium]